jgi:hypothetical protein
LGLQETTLTVYTLPVVTNVTIIQCDDDLDAVTTFNLTVKTVRFQTIQAMNSYTSFSGATTANLAESNSFSLYQHNLVNMGKSSEY